MFKKVILFLVVVFIVSLSAQSSFDRVNEISEKAFKDLDCEFGDCESKEPKIIVKEKIVEKIIYREREPKIVEKIVYRDKEPKVVEKIVYKDREPIVKKTISVVEHEKVVSNRVYNKAFFDVHTKSQAPMLDYIGYTTRSSFNIEQFVDTVTKIKENGVKVYIHGSLEVPRSIQTAEVYMNVGQKYHYNYWRWEKDIFYNGLKTRQNSDYFLVKVRKDDVGNRYVDYKVYILLEEPWKINAAEDNLGPNTFFFKMAPKVRGFKNKFIKAKVFISE